MISKGTNKLTSLHGFEGKGDQTKSRWESLLRANYEANHLSLT
jgi:hypothetical protein